MKKCIVIGLAVAFLMPCLAQNSKTMKTLVTYFSASGVTEGVAKQLARELNADLFKITPAEPYTDADLDWNDKQSRSTLEMKDKSSRPAIANKVKDLKQYDRILIGFPIWWYTCPTIINTFVESYDFGDKTLIPFATSGGSTIKQAYKDLSSTYPQYKWKEGKLLNRRSDIADFVEELK